MSEVTFAKSFLATLDKRPIKLAADHVSDARKHPNQSPYILSKQLHPFPRKTIPSSARQAKSQTVQAILKPMRTGETIIVSDLTLNSTIHDVKTQYARKSGQPQDKIKLLFNKKPASDLKTLQELGVDGETLELSVMVMGGGGSTTPNTAMTPATEKDEPAAPPLMATTSTSSAGDRMDIDSQANAPASEKAQAEVQANPDTAAGTLLTDAFWDDLKGFLAQRLRDEKEGDRLVQTFREAWSKQKR